MAVAGVDGGDGFGPELKDLAARDDADVMVREQRDGTAALGTFVYEDNGAGGGDGGLAGGDDGGEAVELLRGQLGISNDIDALWQPCLWESCGDEDLLLVGSLQRFSDGEGDFGLVGDLEDFGVVVE